MIVNDIYLLKTNLDSDYKNVFDYGNIEFEETDNIKESFKSFLINHHKGENRKSLSNFNRSLKINNKTSSITLPYRYIDIINFNYIIIENYFFFIIGLISENDNETNPSVTLSIKWDAWSNNIDIITRNSSFNNIIRKHCKRFNENNNDITPIYYKNETQNLTTYSKQIEEGIEVLFLKITFNKNTFLDDINIPNNEENPHTPLDRWKVKGYADTPIGNYTSHRHYNLSQKNNRVVVYVPLCILDLSTNKLKDCTFTGISITQQFVNLSNAETIDITFNSQEVTKQYIYNDILRLNIIGNDTDYIDNIELTFNSPFNYDYDSDNNKVTFKTILNLLDVDIGIDCFTFIYPIRITSQLEEQYSNMYVIPSQSLSNLKTYELIEINYNDKIGVNFNDLERNINTNFVNKYLEPKLHIFPFKYLSLKYNDNNIVLSPLNEQYSFFIHKDYRTYEVLFNVLYNLKYIKDKYEAINSSGSLSYCTLAIDDYLIRNGNQRKTNLSLATISGALNVANGIASNNVFGTSQSLVGFYGTFLKDSALLKDLNNVPAINNNSSFAEDDIMYQDRLILLLNSVDINTKEYENLVTYIYTYGYDVNEINDIFKNERFWFDYCKTSNCVLNLPINNDDKKVIENIFNNGVFKNHINKRGKTDIYFKRDGSLNNIEIDLAQEE